MFGNTLSLNDPLNNLTQYGYDKINRLVTENKAASGGGTRTYSRDAVDNLRTLVDRNGRTTTWDYDKLYRPTAESWNGVSGSLGYAYDTASRLTGVTDSTAMGTDFQFTYDARGQLQNEQQYHELMGKNVLFDRDYDAVGNRTKLEANIGGSISGSSIVGGVWDMRNSYTYDAMNRLTYLTQSNRTGANAVAPKQARFAYNAASQLTDLRRYSDTAGSPAALEVHSRLGYDLAGRLTSIAHGKTDIAAGETWNGTSTAPASLGANNLLAGYFLTYDQDNRVASLSSWRDAAKTSYSYNTTDQLTGASSTQIAGLTLPFALPVAETYNLDLNGNRKGSGGASQSSPGTHNRLQTDGTYNYTYDNEGNTTRRTKIVGGQVTDYTWDHRNRLASVTDRVSASGVKAQQVEYVYDAFNQLNGKRVATQFDSSGNVTNWSRYEVIVWADGQEVFRFVDSDGQGSQPARIANRYLWGDSVDQLLADEQYAVGSGPAVTDTTASPTPGNTLWALTDHLGGVRDLVDNNGIIREHNVYDSFGRLVREVDYNAAGQVISSLDPAAVDSVFGFTGRLFDPHTGLQYNRARWYDANTGRWVNQDPIGFAAGDANLYRYLGNHPIMATDPSGLAELVDSWKTGKYRYEVFRDGRDYYIIKYDEGNWYNLWANREFVSITDIVLSDWADGHAPELAAKLLANRSALENLAAGAECVVDNGKALASATIFVLGIVTPGPEDIVIVAFTAKYGIRIAQNASGKWAFFKGAEELTVDAAKEAKDLLQQHLKNPFKKSKPGVSGKAGAKDIPSWASGQKPYVHESGSKYAKRLMDEKYGAGEYPMGPGSEYNKLKKYCDRSFE